MTFFNLVVACVCAVSSIMVFVNHGQYFYILFPLNLLGVIVNLAFYFHYDVRPKLTQQKNHEVKG